MALLSVAAFPARAPAQPPQPAPAVDPDPLFGDFDDQADFPSREQLGSLLGRVPGERYEIQEAKRFERPMRRIAGLFRLGLAWKPGSALRLSLWDMSRTDIYLWNGSRGITLAYYPDFHQSWAAYAATRDGQKPRPAKRVLWATDNGRYRRSGAGTFELHIQPGRLVMTRGNVCLLSVPMEGPPSEVFLEGGCLVRGVAMVASAGVPPEPDLLSPAVGRPADRRWDVDPPQGYTLHRSPNGSVELAAAEKTNQGQASTPIGPPGLCEYVFFVDKADVGTGLFLGNDEGKHLCRLGFFRHQQTGRTVFGLLNPAARELDRSLDDNRQVVPYAGPGQWFRLTWGAGVLKFWTSGDGVHWSQTAPSAEPVEGLPTRVGLYCLSGDKPRSIKLRSLVVRPFGALAALAPEWVAGRVDAATAKADNLDAWEARAIESRPQDVPAELWWRACALRTLAGNPSVSFAQPILERLVDGALAEPRDPQELLRLFDQAAVFSWCTDWGVHERLGQRGERLGLMLARRGYPAPLTAASGAMLRMPIWNENRLPAFSERLLRQELFARMAEGRWDEVARLCRRMRYWDRNGMDQPVLTEHELFLVRLAGSRAARRDIGREPGRPETLVPWRHPLVEQLSKEGFNVLAEFQAALDGQAYREACQIISTASRTEDVDLLPDRRDGRLRVALSVAMELALRDYPELRRVMQEQFGPLGQLRLKQAMAAGDAQAVEAVALQFAGSAAASMAYRWLGDRGMSSGRFSQAAVYYQEALRSATPADRPALDARLRLVGAMTGRDVGRPVTQPVEFGRTRLSAGQFEQLIQQMRQRHGDAADDERPGNICPAPGRYEVKPWAALDGSRVQKPGAMPDKECDWAGRQLAATVAGRLLVVNNQVDQTAFDLDTARQVWAQRGAVAGQAQQWALEPMQPVRVGQRVYCRRLVAEGPELACFDADDGRLLWTARPDGHVASDPLVLGEDILAFTVSYDRGDRLTLWLSSFDGMSGGLRHQSPVAQLADLWQHRLTCRAAMAADRVVASGGGCLACCDCAGRALWVRQEVWLPAPGEGWWQSRPWYEQIHRPPVVVGDRVYATQPGSWVVECDDLRTGRPLWHAADGGLVSVLGATEKQVLVETLDGLLALDPASGRVLWQAAAPDRLETRFCEQTGLVVYVGRVRESDASKPPRLVMVWVDAATGAVREQTVLNTPAEPEPWFGPLVGGPDRFWGFFAAAQSPANRTIFELLPVVPAPAPTAPAGPPSQ